MQGPKSVLRNDSIQSLKNHPIISSTWKNLVKAQKSLTAPNNTLEELASFYEGFYSPESIEVATSEKLLESIERTLDLEGRESLEKDISIDSALSALSAMKPRKSPGSDGLPSEFYTCLRNILGSDLVEVLNQSFQSGKFSESMRLAIISLIFKKGDQLLLKNWRPISLLNVD